MDKKFAHLILIHREYRSEKQLATQLDKTLLPPIFPQGTEGADAKFALILSNITDSLK